MRTLALAFAIAFSLLGSVTGSRAQQSVTFTDVTAYALAGIADSPGRDGVPPGFTGGAAVGDCNRDGLLDVYFTGAAHDVLYQSRGDGTFEDVTVRAGLGSASSTRGAAFADIDNDGDLDLLAGGGSSARHFLYINDGRCLLNDQAAQRGLLAEERGAIPRSVSFGDYDRDGYLDFFVAELQSDQVNPGVSRPISRLFHNRGAVHAGYFDDVTMSAGVVLDGVAGSQAGSFAFTGRFTDLDADGWPDLVIASDFGESRLFWNDRNGHFTDGTVAAGVGTDQFGVGLTPNDFDGDGRFDLFVTSIFVPPPRPTAGDGNRLYRNRGNRTFADVTDAAGVRDGLSGRGVEGFDYDNDGDVDVIQNDGIGPSVGDDRPGIGSALGGIDLTPFSTDPPRLWRNDGSGAFTDVAASAGISDDGIGAGVVTFDYDGDGDLDVLLTHACCANEPPRLLRNDGGNAGHWLEVELAGVSGQRHPNGIGAVVTVTPVGRPAMVQEVSASSTYLAQNGTGRLHFGLGSAPVTVSSIRIVWPDGAVQTVSDPPTDTLQRIRENVVTEPTAERDCILALNTAGADVAAAVGKRLIECVADATGRKLPAGETVAECLSADPRGTIAAREARTEDVAARRCTAPPSFGPPSAAAVNAAMRGVFRLQDVFGPDIDAALVDGRSDPQGAACQVAVMKGVVKVARAQLKTFNDCKRAGLKRDTIHSGADIAACYATTEGRAVARVAARANRRAAKKCAGTNLAGALPGKCAAAPAGQLFGCLRDQMGCGTCLALNAADRLTKPCHRFADGVATLYCGDRPTTNQSIARQWNEALLAAIRVDAPRPPVHARNLFHLSAAMWDAWRAYGGGGTAWLTDESHPSDDPDRDRTIAISFAAYRIISQRFRLSAGRVATQAALRARMSDLGLDADFVGTEGDVPAAVGNRIGRALLAWGATDGSNEDGNYNDPTYVPVNPPLVVKEPGTTMIDPNRWQPLALDLIITQNGIPLPGKIQTFVGAGWNQVTPFALTRDDPDDIYIDPGPPPLLGGVGDDEYKAGNVEVLLFSSQLDPTDPATLDISPGAWGNNPLGTNDGHGYPLNPVTGQPYPPQIVKRADFARVLSEFWADGPQSETPPGHWNVVANYVSDHPATVKRIAGTGPVVSDLEWDVKMYLAVNGAEHDAAIACWGAKRKYDSVRPISQIRYMGGRGQSSDPTGPSYHPQGLPLVPGLIEVVTPESSAPGERHAGLAPFVGEIAVHAWPGEPADPATQFSGAIWYRAKRWVPFQQKTFVTPPFGSYFSGHSTYSRAAAETLTRFTGSPYFPDGLGEFVARANAFLRLEVGPTTDVRLQWAAYYDAADQAGISRLFGGIHPRVDDFTGRRVGAQVGVIAFDRAVQLFTGTSP